MKNKDWNSYIPRFAASSADTTTLSRDWVWLLVGGIISSVLGVLAWRAPVVASAGIAAALGAILLVSGIMHMVQAIRFRHYGGVAWRVFQAVISIVGGGIMLRYPVIGIIGVGLTIIFYLFMSSASQFMMALALRPMRGSGLLFMSSIVAFFLGVVLTMQLPFSALWLPGVFLAVDLVIAGVTMMLLSFRLRRLRGQRPAEITPEERRAA